MLITTRHITVVPGPGTGTCLQPVRNRDAQQEVSSGQASEASSAAPRRSPLVTLLPEPSLPIRGKIVFHEMGPWGQKDWGLLLYREFK